MLDIRRIRDETENVRTGILNKREQDILDDLLLLDEERRRLIQEGDSLKNKRNLVSEEIARLKKSGASAEDRITEMKIVSETIGQLDSRLRELDERIEILLLGIPNIPHASVPVGSGADENVEIRRWIPEPVHGLNAKADFDILDHVVLGKKLGILDFERGAKVSGSGFPVYVGRGATLERALINFMIDFHLEKHGYTEIFPPFLVNRDSMIGTGQLPKMADDMYRIEEDDLYPIPTAEVPITNFYRDEMLTGNELPKYLCGYSACFRREAGSYGKETKGFLRVHQFNKVEMVKFTQPESSYEELERLVVDAEDILQALRIPYRVILLCTGDLSFASAKTYDIEVWSPAEEKWLEASSCSNFEDFQARRARIRFKRGAKAKPEFVHTLNGSGLATSRLMVSLLENNQTPEGKVIVPAALHRYTGHTIIG